MMNLTEAAMTDDDGVGQSHGRRIMWIILASLGIVMVAGAIMGFLAEHRAQGDGPLGTGGILVILVFAALIAGLSFSIWINGRKIKSSGEPLTKKERLNRNILIASVSIGAAFGVFFVATGTLSTSSSAAVAFEGDTLEPSLALFLAFIWGVAMPIFSWFWHKRVIDEQEASATRDGGYYAAYALLVGAPTWWLLWRGGLVPEPDGVAIFMLFSLIWSAVWLWKKYG